MKLVGAYLITQLIALIILGFNNPLALLAIPIGLVASYGLMILFYNIISGRGFRL